MTVDPNQPPESRNDTEAMARLANHWSAASPSLEAFVRALVHDAHDRDDVIQSTGEYVAREFHKFEEGTSFVAWVITVARFRIHVLWQDQKRDRLIVNSEAIDALSQATTSVAEKMSVKQEAVQACIERLQYKHRKLLELCYWENQKPAQIAEQLGRTSNSVSASLMRIRAALKRCVETRLKQ